MAKKKASSATEKRVNRNRLLDKRQLPDLPDARRQMIERLAKLESISKAVLEIMAELPRHAFAPFGQWRAAYGDSELWCPTIFLPRPSTVARIATAVEQAKANKVLEYATGTGFITSVLAMLAHRVDTVEHDPWLLWLSSDAFRELELSNVSQKASDGYLGWRERGPYDAIVVSAAMPRIPRTLLEQLVEGGICVAPVGTYYGPHRLIQATKSREGTSVGDLGACYFPPLTGVWTYVDMVWKGPEIEAEPRWATTWPPAGEPRAYASGVALRRQW
jgi:protein-L-isoaspartate(D-aspartate) O-methyltransferase